MFILALVSFVIGFCAMMYIVAYVFSGSDSGRKVVVLFIMVFTCLLYSLAITALSIAVSESGLIVMDLKECACEQTGLGTLIFLMFTAVFSYVVGNYVFELVVKSGIFPKHPNFNTALLMVALSISFYTVTIPLASAVPDSINHTCSRQQTK